MRFLNRLGRLSSKAAAGAIFCLMVFGGAAVAQDQGQVQPKTPAGQLRRRPPASPPRRQ